jgi:hypothetical protein
MAETVLERHYRDRVQSVRQIALHETGQAALSRSQWEDLVALCAELSAAGGELLEKEYRRLFKEPNPTVAWLLERRQVIEDLSASYVQLAESVRAAVYQAAQASGSPSGKDFVLLLDRAIQAILQARQRVLERWPVGSEAEIEEASSSAARGQGLDVDEAFAQIAGVDVETWRRRLEEHKQHRPA